MNLDLVRPAATRRLRIAMPCPPRFRIMQALGALWLVDGLLQLQPVMFTSYLTRGIMEPAIQGQPDFLAFAEHIAVAVAAIDVPVFNSFAAAMQIAIGLALLSRRFVFVALRVSIVWSLAVWFAGEGLGGLWTGQAGLLTGAPGPVLLYALLAFAILKASDGDEPLHVFQQRVRGQLAFVWLVVGLLQIQPYWWHDGRIAQAIADSQSPGTLNGAIFDRSLAALAGATSHIELPLNLGLILLCFALALGLSRPTGTALRLVLGVSLALGIALWWATASGPLLTGTSTDVNSGPLFALMTLAAWPRYAAPDPDARPTRSLSTVR